MRKRLMKQECQEYHLNAIYRDPSLSKVRDAKEMIALFAHLEEKGHVMLPE
jgi:hypothetical protein